MRQYFLVMNSTEGIDGTQYYTVCDGFILGHSKKVGGSLMLLGNRGGDPVCKPWT